MNGVCFPPLLSRRFTVLRMALRNPSLRECVLLFLAFSKSHFLHGLSSIVPWNRTTFRNVSVLKPSAAGGRRQTPLALILL